MSLETSVSESGERYVNEFMFAGKMCFTDCGVEHFINNYIKIIILKYYYIIITIIGYNYSKTTTKGRRGLMVRESDS